MPDINIAGIQVGTMTASIIDEPFANKLPTVVVGNDFFKKYHAIIDTNERLLFLNSNEISRKSQHDLQQLLEKQDYQKIPLTQLNSGHYILPVQINGAVPVYMLFDTGTGGTILSIPYMNFLKINPNTLFQNQKATNGTIKVSEITVSTMTLNPLQSFFEKPVVLNNSKITSANIASLEKMLGVVGIIGLSEMEQIHSVIDTPTESVFIR